MITTIREQLETGRIARSQTAFSACPDSVLDMPLPVAPFLEWQTNRSGQPALYQKNMAEAVPLAEAERRLNVSLPGLPELPWFCEGLEDLAEARRQGKAIAVEGGPCLFGVNEVMTEVVLSDGSSRFFDYSTGRRKDAAEAAATSLLQDFLAEHAGEITAVRFRDCKEGVTTQERDSILWLFRIAAPLGASVVLPLPDMSYRKYMQAITEPLPPEVARGAREAFAAVAHRIAQLYIDLAAEIGKDYPQISCTIVHDRDEALCERYYRERAPHIERHKILRNITSIPQKLESIKDYISMPALPLYLNGITEILQVDSLDEIDSFRRCRRSHRNAIRLACMLYPERLSADGVNTIFQTTHEYKEYI